MSSANWYDEWKKKAQEYKPCGEIDQGVLWLKQMGLMSDHFKDIREQGKPNITEAFLNHMMQYAYDMGCRAIDERSYENGRWSMWKEVCEKLGVENGEGY
jgi:hypothetical protein